MCKREEVPIQRKLFRTVVRRTLQYDSDCWREQRDRNETWVTRTSSGLFCGWVEGRRGNDRFKFVGEEVV